MDSLPAEPQRRHCRHGLLHGADGRILEHRHDSEPRPQTFVEWLVWLALWPIVAVAWLVALPFVLIYVAVGFIMEALFATRLRLSDDSDGTDSAG